MNKQFYFQTSGSFTNEISYQENEKKYLLTGLDAHNIIISTRFQTQLICPDDNSILANHIKNDPYADGTFATPVSNLEFKPNFLQKGKYNYGALLIKDTNQLKKAELEKPAPRQVAKWPSSELTFKVINQKKGKVDERGNYEHELEIEPFALEIEGVPKISRIVFDFSSPLPGQIEAEKSIKDTELYNSKLLTESAGKTFTMKIRRWQLLDNNKTLNFHGISDFDLDSFQETTNRQQNNFLSPRHDNSDTSQGNKGLIIGAGIILTIFGLILTLLW